MKMTTVDKRVILPVFLIIFSSVVFQGCVATRNWVKEQFDPLANRVAEGEERSGQRFTKMEGQMGRIDAKAEEALSGVAGLRSTVANLRLAKRLVLDVREGVNFDFDSAKLPMSARLEIDGLLSDLQGDARLLEQSVFLVAGHTDGTGPADYNYELGRKRAESVARYLITQKHLNPLRVVTVSYGKDSPVTDNRTREGRAKNRRVELFVYQEGIVSGTPEQAAKTDASDQHLPSEQLSSNPESAVEIR